MTATRRSFLALLGLAPIAASCRDVSPAAPPAPQPYTAPATQARAITCHNIHTGTISASQICRGTITASSIAVGTITAKKLMVSRDTEIVHNRDGTHTIVVVGQPMLTLE